MQLFLPLLALCLAAEAAVFVNPSNSNVAQSVIQNVRNPSGCQDSKRVCAKRPKCGTGGSCIGTVCYCYKHGAQCPPMPSI